MRAHVGKRHHGECGGQRQRRARQPRTEAPARACRAAVHQCGKQHFKRFDAADKLHPAQLFQAVAAVFKHGHQGDEVKADEGEFVGAAEREQQPVAAARGGCFADFRRPSHGGSFCGGFVGRKAGGVRERPSERADSGFQTACTCRCNAASAAASAAASLASTM